VAAAVAVMAIGRVECRDESMILVRSITVTGAHSVDVSALKKALVTKASSKFPWGTKYYFDRSQFEGDLNRIRAFYSDRGFPNARITHHDVKLTAKQDAADVTIAVEEGTPIVLTDVVLAGFEGVPQEDLDRLRKALPVKPMQPRDRQSVLAAKEMALNALRDHGYPYASVNVEEDDSPTGAEACLTLAGEAGQLAHFGDTQIQGSYKVDEDVIRRALTFKSGEIYRRSRVLESQRGLADTMLFQFVNIEPLDVDQQPAHVPMRVTVTEGPHQHLNLSVGYGTEELLRVDGTYRRLNFFGGGRSAGVHARWSSVEKGVQADLTQPYLFNPRISLTVQAQQWYSYMPAYQSTVTGGTITGTYRPRPRLSIAVSLTAEYDSSSIAESALNDPTLRNDLIALGLNPVTGEQNGSLNALKIEATHSTADSALNPHRGYQVVAFLEQAGRIFPGTFRYTEVWLDGRQYVPLGDRVVLANRVQAANIAAPADDPGAVPFSRKLFLGGATSIRGWGRYEVSPLSGSGLPIGGNSLFAFSSEIRAPIYESLGAVAFLDAGNVWADSGAFQLNDLRYAVGSGLRYQTRVGPIRFDFGYQLNPIPGLVVNGEPQSHRWRLHFSIGQAF
jgi:outer membrane protein assembly complex protein YaeT